MEKSFTILTPGPCSGRSESNVKAEQDLHPSPILATETPSSLKEYKWQQRLTGQKNRNPYPRVYSQHLEDDTYLL